MTDPVTNLEIEDVLSSIRRLVSDDVRTVAPKPAVVQQPERLVLTPSLRVSSEVSETRNEPAESEAEDRAPILLTDLAPLVEEAAPAESTADGEDVFADDFTENDGAPVSFQQDDLVEPEAETDLSDAALDDLAFDDTHEDDAEHDTAEDVHDDTAREDSGAQSFVHREPDGDAGESTYHTDEDIADLGADAGVDDVTAGLLSKLVGDEIEQALADLTAEDAAEPATEEDPRAFAPGQEAEAELDITTEDFVQLESAEDTLPEPEPEPEPDPEPELEADPEAETLESKLAALEDLVGQVQEDDWEPEQPQLDTPVFHRSSEVLDWQDHLTAVDQAEEFDDAPSHPDEQAATSTEPAPAGLMVDEDVLRGMVSEIVRQELQGVLGERITRNVRKLVRREIHRVLMSQDFE